MSEAAAAPQGRLAAWCGWVTVGALALAPVLGWLGYLGFPILLALMGLMMAPALRIRAQDRPAVVLLLVALIWAAMSSAWSPYHPGKAANNTALKLAFELPLYWAAVCGVRQAGEGARRVGLAVLAWGWALFGLVLFVEFATDAAIYERLHVAFYEPIRHDLAQVNVAHASFVLMLLTPIAAAAAVRSRASAWLALPMVVGAVAAALRFKAEAPAVAAVLAAGVGFAAWRWPRGGPRGLAIGAVVYSLAAPLVIWAARAAGLYAPLKARVEESWAERMGYWSHAVDWIKDHPVRGWGLDASRMFGPGIILHPHDDALQVWLELGLVGALIAAGFWWLSLRRLERDRPDLGAAAVAASAAVYLLFGALNFGAWQEWWLALGALIAAAAALLLPAEPAKPST